MLGWGSPPKEQGARQGGGWHQTARWGLLCPRAGGRVAGCEQRLGKRRLQDSLSQPSFPYNSGKEASPLAAPSQGHKLFPVSSALPCVVPGWGTAAAGQVASMGPSVPCAGHGPTHGMDGCLPPALLWHHHRNGLKSVLLVSSYTNLKPPQLETAKVPLLSHTQHLPSPRQRVPWSRKGTGCLCPHTLGVTVSPARLGQWDMP